MGFWEKRPAYFAPSDIDIFHYVREGPDFEASKTAAVKLFRDVGIPEHGIAELCNDRCFNTAAPDFERACRELATAWLLGHPQPRPGRQSRNSGDEGRSLKSRKN